MGKQRGKWNRQTGIFPFNPTVVLDLDVATCSHNAVDFHELFPVPKMVSKISLAKNLSSNSEYAVSEDNNVNGDKQKSTCPDTVSKKRVDIRA